MVDKQKEEEMVEVQYKGTSSRKEMGYEWSYLESQTIPYSVAQELAKSDMYIVLRKHKKKEKLEILENSRFSVKEIINEEIMDEEVNIEE